MVSPRPLQLKAEKLRNMTFLMFILVSKTPSGGECLAPPTWDTPSRLSLRAWRCAGAPNVNVGRTRLTYSYFLLDHSNFSLRSWRGGILCQQMERKVKWEQKGDPVPSDLQGRSWYHHHAPNVTHWLFPYFEVIKTSRRPVYGPKVGSWVHTVRLSLTSVLVETANRTEYSSSLGAGHDSGNSERS